MALHSGKFNRAGHGNHAVNFNFEIELEAHPEADGGRRQVSIHKL